MQQSVMIGGVTASVCQGLETNTQTPCACNTVLPQCYECSLVSLPGTGLPPIPAECSVCKGSTYLFYGRCRASCPAGTRPVGEGVFNRRCQSTLTLPGPSALSMAVDTELSFFYNDTVQFTNGVLSQLVNQISLSFRTSTRNGVLLFSQNPSPAIPDFLAIELVNGQVVCRFDLGSGMAVLDTSSQSLGFSDNMWHTVQVLRVQSTAVMSVDDVTVTADAPGLSVSLEVGAIMMGAVTSNKTISQFGILGCTRQGMVDDFPLDVQHATGLTGTPPSLCPSTACDAAKCVNGECVSNSSTSYTCACFSGFGGALCDHAFDVCADTQPCNNGGICNALSNITYACDCKLGFSGPTCQYGKIIVLYTMCILIHVVYI